MMKIIKYVLAITVIIVIAYNSVFFRSLAKLKAEKELKKFNAKEFADSYIKRKLLPSVDDLLDFDVLMRALRSSPQKAFKSYSNSLAIGNIRFFMVKGKGIITSISDDNLSLITAGGEEVNIATEFVFGNALRDASGAIKVDDFNNSTDLNNVSAEINKIVREQILPPVKSKVRKGEVVNFAGAFELNQEYVNLNNIEILPVKLTIQ
ncbi:DUF2291 domain-containing protein [Pedobacter sp.]|uniref:DUF2291 domain-containing protein n=1 Tax=Pedobacter sp. TaxID=1411316 RepID=UPI003C319C9E